MSLTYLGHSAVRLSIGALEIYIDPYLRDPIDWTKLPKGDLVLLTHGHFDHGVLMSPKLYGSWKCKFAGPRTLMQWMTRKYRKVIPAEAFLPLDVGESLLFQGTRILATPAHHPINRLGKTIFHVFARSSAPGKPVVGFYIDGFFHSGDTIYTSSIAESLKGLSVHTACIPVGGKYAVAGPTEALRIAEEIGAEKLVPLHWQPLVEQVPFRYQSSDLVKVAKAKKSAVKVCALAIGELLQT